MPLRLVPDENDAPKVGDEVYVPTQGFIDRGCDDRLGGLAVVKNVERRDHGDFFIQVETFRGVWFNWTAYLKGHQAEWRTQYGTQRARPDPDDHPDSNRGW